MSKKFQEYSQLAFAISLVSFEYKTSNPIILSEKMEEDLGLHYSIHQISDYMDINRLEDYEKETNKITYETN
jgi:hypothetical protein